MKLSKLFILVLIYKVIETTLIKPPNVNNKLRFPYGVNFKYNGIINHNLARVWIVNKFPMPKWEEYNFPDIEFLPDSNFRYTESHLQA